MAGLNDSAGADGLSLSPWADIQCCPHPYIRANAARISHNFENVMRRQMRQPHRDPRRHRQQSGANRSQSCCEHQIIQPVVQRRVDRRSPRRLRPVGRRAQAMISGAKGWRLPHDPQRGGFAARSAIAAMTVPV